MIILALNAGSSSWKFATFDADNGSTRTLASGSIERSASGLQIELRVGDGAASTEHRDTQDISEAVPEVLRRIASGSLPIEAVGHRVVHGGGHVAHTRIDAAVLSAIEAAQAQAPLHNAAALRGIAASQAVFPGLPAVAVFDTAFHTSMPARASTYALPAGLAEKYEIRRHGFHGIAHQSMAEGYARLSGAAADEVNIVTLQLGSGCSACAIKGGRSVDTSMGFAPSEGLLMATRAGDIDASIGLFLQRVAGLSLEEVDEVINRRSGLLGVSGTTGDMRALLAAEANNDEPAKLAIEMFVYRIQKVIGAYMATLNGTDAIVFGGAIGERSATVRQRICTPLGALGISIDEALNNGPVLDGRRIDSGGSVAVWVIPPDEQQIIARETYRVLAGGGMAG
jgi:acetate kinase